ncbi:PaaI family thioesterase [Arenibacter palladensis]|uniref:PaaI family thioesterase n=1 Tax=Arenibacter palladensis TaxID=237373 RepID=UPI0026E3E7D6|nr:PaaI family thioesterase [Arenibacter palladensis]MDO6602222.1 PaaI family thioesterase [Arenibacter palladensis]
MSRLELLKSFVGQEFRVSPSPLMRWLNPTIISAQKGNLVFKYQVRPEWLNPIGNLHGGITAAIIDDILGATMFSLDEPSFFTTINNVIDYFSVAKPDQIIIAETFIVKLGKQFVNAECNIWNNERTRLIAKGKSNFFKTETNDGSIPQIQMDMNVNQNINNGINN